MQDTPVPHPERAHPTVRGHVIGIADSLAGADALPGVLDGHGVESARVMILDGPVGLQKFDAMMRGSQWGEQAEKLRAQGRAELQDGRAIVCVEVADEEEAARIAGWLTPLGVRSLHHFGALIDTQLTA